MMEPWTQRVRGGEDVIRVADQFYILATSSRVDDRTRVMKHGETFAVFDRFGDIAPVGMGELGLYHEGTRFLSRLTMALGGERPLLLSSNVRKDNLLLAVDLTNPDLTGGADGEVLVPRGRLHVAREKLLRDGVCHERIRTANYGHAPVELDLTLRFDADFADIFEVRGVRRERRGERLPDEVDASGRVLVLSYEGLDGVLRRTRIEVTPAPSAAAEGELRFHAILGGRQAVTFGLTIACERGRPAPRRFSGLGGKRQRRLTHRGALAGAAREFERRRALECEVETTNEHVNLWIERSRDDLHMMVTETPTGPYPYAGVPWFSAPFGRDGILTALELLWVNPAIARGVLSFLAATQADRTVEESDAEPGKVIHEMRGGEMAALGEVPFGCYYGSVDATPLFVVLARAYHERTGDGAFAARLWPHVERALAWMDRSGDPDGDGFIEYARRSAHGLVHQGWKDSKDAVFHEDGEEAAPPIALCEVQAYAYAARAGAASLARALGHPARAATLEAQATALARRFDEAFWLEDIGTYALALDGEKRPCRVRASNAGHCLLGGIARPGRAERVAAVLLGEPFFSGFGVRTLATTEARFNPMSYHNGSVWPHDNAIIAAGCAASGLREPVLAILEGLAAAAEVVDGHRLPELFCGFERRRGEAPILYPVACSPQAWAAGAVFLLLGACLGLTVDGVDGRVTFSHPTLPASIEGLRLTNLRVGRATVTVELERHAKDVGVRVIERRGPVEIVVVK